MSIFYHFRNNINNNFIPRCSLSHVILSTSVSLFHFHHTNNAIFMVGMKFFCRLNFIDFSAMIYDNSSFRMKFYISTEEFRSDLFDKAFCRVKLYFSTFFTFIYASHSILINEHLISYFNLWEVLSKFSFQKCMLKMCKIVA